MAGSQVVTVNNEAIARLFGAGGDAGRWLGRRTREVERVARRKAPVGPPRVGTSHAPGHLRRSHGRTGVLKNGRYAARSAVFNSAGYAAVVHEGFAGKIYPHSSKFLWIPSSSLGLYRPGAVAFSGAGTMKPFTTMRSVNGQRANPWLERAMLQVFARSIAFR